MKVPALALTASLAVMAGCGPRSARSAACDRACLKGVVDSYFDALVRHDAAKLPTAPPVKFTENGRALALGDGLWKTADAIKYRLDAYDPANSQAATEAVVQEGSELAHLMVRLKVEDNRRISEVETIVCRKGQQDLFAPEKLIATPPLYEATVPPSERNTREQMASMADGYFSALQTEGTADYKPAPLSDDANRFENGIQTTNVAIFGLPAATASEQLDKAFYKGLTLVHRRFPVIDEDHGIALGIAVMQIRQAEPQGLLLSEMFKISGGKIRQIQAVLVNHPIDGPTGWN